MGAPVRITRTDYTAADLRGFAAKSNDAGQVRRSLALALIMEGHPRASAAARCGMDRQTLRDWAELPKVPRAKHVEGRRRGIAITARGFLAFGRYGSAGVRLS